jgi:transcriptional regulator with XRE-family HTH domain
MKQSILLLDALKRELKLRGWTGRKLALHFGIGEATAKRWLAGKGLSLDQFDTLLELCDLNLADLARSAEHPKQPLAQELTLAQENALFQDQLLSFIFIVILGGYDWREVASDFGIADRQVDAMLLRLERLALIDRLPGGRARALIDRTIVWRKAPMRTQFELRMKPRFMELDFSAEETVYASEMIKLSAHGAAALAELIEKHRREVQELAERDRETSLLPQSWFATLQVVRPFTSEELRAEL